MNSMHRRLPSILPSFLQNPFRFLPYCGTRKRRAARRALYLEYLEDRVLLSITLSTFTEFGHHNTSLSFNLTDFQNAFVDTSGGNLAQIEFTTLPTHGTLTLNGSTVTQNHTFGPSDVANLLFVPNHNYSGRDSIGWNGGDTASLADSPAVINIVVSESAPTLTPIHIFVTTNSTGSALQASDFNVGFNDADPGDNNNLQQIQFAPLPTNGTLTYDGSPVAVGQIFTVDQISNITYVPASGYNGTDSFGWSAMDGTQWAASGANANIAVSSTPVVYDITKTTLFNTPLSFDFNADFLNAFGDASGQTLEQIEITSLPTHGTLYLNGTSGAVTQFQILGTSDVAGLSYVPDADYQGADTIGWNGSDGTAYADSPANINITVSKAAPTIKDVFKFVLTNTPTAFQASDFTSHFFPASSGNLLTDIEVTTLPSLGTLTFNGANVTAGQDISVDQIANLTYTPATDYTGSDPFTWTAYDGAVWAAAGANVNIAVSSTPLVTDIDKNGNHNTTLNFTASDFASAFFYTNTVSLQQIQILALPAGGTLELNGQPVTLNQMIDISQINGLANGLTYVPNLTTRGSDMFSWTGSSGTSSANNTAHVLITVQESVPTIAAITKNVPKNTLAVFSAADFNAGFTDADPGDNGNLQTLMIMTLPANGTLKMLNGTTSAVTVGQLIPANQLSNLEYVAQNGYLGSDSFTWNASDGLRFAAADATVNLTVSDTPPVLSNITLSAKQNATIPLSPAVFTNAFTDADAGDSLVNVAIAGLPTYGTLKLSGVPVYSYQVIPLNQLGKLTYTPNTNFAGAETITWTASDGQQPATSNAMIVIQVAGKTPTVGPVGKGVVENSTSFSFSSWDFIQAFTEPNVGPILRSITVTTLPTHGTLILNNSAGTAGTVVTAGQVITADQIANLSYLPNLDYIGADAFGWKGSDGINTSASASTVNLTVVSSTVLTVTGNGQVIPTGSTLTSPVNFTYFGSGTYFNNSVDGQPFTRTYTITNNSAATISFTGGANLIRISGQAHIDYTPSGFTDIVLNQTVSSLTPQESATFTIVYSPYLAGNRPATVNIPFSSGGKSSTFSFAIDGTGVDTYDVPANSSVLPGLQYATTQKGTGPSAVNGDVLTMNYTGYLLNGDIFDSSLNPGRTPFQFSLGQGQVIQGWDPGLLGLFGDGIKVGEKRTLVIPSTLGYGNSTTNASIPAGSTLIFDVQCLGIGVPRIGVATTGSNQYITPNSTKPSTADGTNFGTLSATQSSFTASYTIYNIGYSDPTGSYSAVYDFTHNPAETLSGPNASDFSMHAGTSSTFSITFNKPADSAVRTARVTVYTNDPINPTYSFTILAAAAPYTDLAGTLVSTTLPPAIVSNASFSSGITVSVANLGNLMPAGQQVTVQILAQNVDTLQDTVLATSGTLSVAGLKAGAATKITIPLNSTAGLPAGTYKLEAQINPVQTLVESNTSNNLITLTASSQYLTILSTSSFYDLTGTLGTSTLPATSVVGFPVTGTVNVTVSNGGNVALPAGQQVQIQLLAHPTTGSGPDVVLGNATASVASLAVGASNSVPLSVSLPNGMSADSYIVEAQISPIQTLVESNTSNNLITLNAAGHQISYVSNASTNDLTGILGKSKLPGSGIAGLPVTGKVNVIVSNGGNVALPAGQQIQIQIIAHPAAGADVILGNATASVSALAANGAKTVTVPLSVNFTAGIAAGSYTIEAQINPLQTLVDSNTSNNLITVNAAGQHLGYVSNASTNDLTGILGTSTLPASHLSGTPFTGTVKVIVSNKGNFALPAGQQIQIQLIAHPAAGADVILGNATASVSALAANGAKTVTVPLSVNFTAGIATGSYTIEAQINPIQTLVDSNTSNNLITVNAAGKNITYVSSSSFYDLTGVLGTSTLPASDPAGSPLAGRVNVIISNIGNLALKVGQQVQIQLFAHPTSGIDIPLGNATASISALAANGAKTVTVPLAVNLPAGLTTGSYILEAVLTPDPIFTESNTLNNIVILTAASTNIPLLIT